jgi:hypothetical protein
MFGQLPRRTRGERERPRKLLAGKSSGPRRPWHGGGLRDRAGRHTAPVRRLGAPFVRGTADYATGSRSGAEAVRGRRFDGVLPLLRDFLLLGARRRDRWGAHREPEAREEGLGGLGRVDGGEDPHATSAAAQDVDRKDAAQQVGQKPVR